jgi:hypothetical protein
VVVEPASGGVVLGANVPDDVRCIYRSGVAGADKAMVLARRSKAER